MMGRKAECISIDDPNLLLNLERSGGKSHLALQSPQSLRYDRRTWSWTDHTIFFWTGSSGLAFTARYFQSSTTFCRSSSVNSLFESLEAQFGTWRKRTSSAEVVTHYLACLAVAIIVAAAAFPVAPAAATTWPLIPDPKAIYLALWVCNTTAIPDSFLNNNACFAVRVAARAAHQHFGSPSAIAKWGRMFNGKRGKFMHAIGMYSPSSLSEDRLPTNPRKEHKLIISSEEMVVHSLRRDAEALKNSACWLGQLQTRSSTDDRDTANVGEPACWQFRQWTSRDVSCEW